MAAEYSFMVFALILLVNESRAKTDTPWHRQDPNARKNGMILLKFWLYFFAFIRGIFKRNFEIDVFCTQVYKLKNIV